MPVITCIEDLKRLHQKRTPKMFWDYCESGSYTEQTFRENTSDFAKLRLRQRVARDLTGRTLSSTMAGQPVTMPSATSSSTNCCTACLVRDAMSASSACRMPPGPM